jgi:hypothetical protein
MTTRGRSSGALLHQEGCVFCRGEVRTSGRLPRRYQDICPAHHAVLARAMTLVMKALDLPEVHTQWATYLPPEPPESSTS